MSYTERTDNSSFKNCIVTFNLILGKYSEAFLVSGNIVKGFLVDIDIGRPLGHESSSPMHTHNHSFHYILNYSYKICWQVLIIQGIHKPSSKWIFLQKGYQHFYISSGGSCSGHEVSLIIYLPTHKYYRYNLYVSIFALWDDFNFSCANHLKTLLERPIYLTLIVHMDHHHPFYFTKSKGFLNDNGLKDLKA